MECKLFKLIINFFSSLKWAQSRILYLFVNNVVLPLSNTKEFLALDAINVLWKVRIIISKFKL